MKRLIDANALHAKILEENRRNYAATENVAQILLRIETAPTIDAEPVRHGHWWYDCPNAIFTCSECLKMYRDNPNYCPRCGAKMDDATDTNVDGKGGA